jgi:hypothetical protein
MPAMLGTIGHAEALQTVEHSTWPRHFAAANAQ